MVHLARLYLYITGSVTLLELVNLLYRHGRFVSRVQEPSKANFYCLLLARTAASVHTHQLSGRIEAPRIFLVDADLPIARQCVHLPI